MRLPLTALTALLLVAGCGGASEEPGTPQERAQTAATSACTDVAPLLSRPGIRRSDVSALGRAQASAKKAAGLDTRWSELQRATTAAREAARDVEAGTRAATTNAEQSRVNAAYRAAVTALESACRTP